jgi:hypothetical protein
MDKSNPVFRQGGLVKLGYGLGAYVVYAAVVSVLLLHVVGSVGASAAPPVAPLAVRSLISPTNVVVVSIIADDGYASVVARCRTTSVVSADVILVNSTDEQDRLLRALDCLP